MAMFSTWADVSEPEDLAWLIAHQSGLETEVRRQEIHRGLNATERISTIKRYLAALQKARVLWNSMENTDQRALWQCIAEVPAGHEIKDVLELDQWLRGFNSDYPIAEWRKPTLIKHRSWRMDTEMLDILIGAAHLWLVDKSPKRHEKIDPTLYAIIYICGNCANHNINISSAETSRFTQIVATYFHHTNFLDNAKPEDHRKSQRKDFKDIIEKAKTIWQKEYADYFKPFDTHLKNEQLELFD